MTPHEQEQMDYTSVVTAMRMLRDKNPEYFMRAATYMLENNGFVVHTTGVLQELDKLSRVYTAVGHQYSQIPHRYHGRVPVDVTR